MIDALHFIRPLWLIALPVILLVWWLVRRRDASQAMVDACNKISATGDSVGGIVKVVASGVPAGLGEPVFDKLDAELGSPSADDPNSIYQGGAFCTDGIHED